jgi:predicted amidohydrolase
VAVAQIRPRKADYPANLDRMGEVMKEAAGLRRPADVLVFPETAATGYFLEGGVAEQATTAQQFYEDLRIRYVASGLKRPLDVVAGFYESAEGHLYNATLYAELSPTGGRLLHVHRKVFLPTYGVFDEGRFVRRGRGFRVFPTRFRPAVILICEDVWHSISATIAALKGAQLVYVVAASPGRGFGGETVYNHEKYRQLLLSIAQEHSVFVFGASMVGFEGGKGLIGGSLIASPFGQITVEAPTMEEALLVCDCNPGDVELARDNSPLLADLHSHFGDILGDLTALGRAQNEEELL